MSFEALDPERARVAGEARIGGKALGLARLAALAAHVPAWWVVPIEVLAAHLARPALHAALSRCTAELAAIDVARPDAAAALDVAAQPVRALIVGTPLDPADHAALCAQLARLGPGPYAVRSSMVGEDAAQHSFAGQLESFLFQRTADDVATSILRCWASAFSGRALHYAVRCGRRAAPEVGVVVQQMIPGAISGVLFTAHPVTGRRDHALLTAAWGLGEGVVSGRCNTDEYVWSHAGTEVSATIADKDLAIVPAPGVGAIEAEVAADRRHIRCLRPDQVAQICREGLRVAAALGAPQDLEWTIDPDGVLHLLQARPITSLAPAPSGPRVVWNNSNIQESYCGVTTPLTFSLAREAYASVYEQFLRVLGMPEPAIAAHRPTFRNMLGLVRGRIYYNINNWYRLLTVLPSFGRNKADMERMMGLDRSVDFVEGQRLSLWQKAVRAPRLLRNELRLRWRFSRIDHDVATFLRDFQARTRHYDRAQLAGHSLSELVDSAERLRSSVMGNWHTPIVNDFFVMRISGRLRRLVERTRRPDGPELLGRIMSGEPGIESTEPTRLLLRMARTARDTPGLARTLCAEPPLAALARIRIEFPVFAASFDRYIERYGDRCMGELKLETISHREDPSFIVTMLRNYLERPDLDPDAAAARERQHATEAEATLRAALPWYVRGRLRPTIAAARRAVKHRENMRMARTRGFGLSRDLWRAIGQRLHEAGRLDHPRDVFYLSRDEVRDYHQGAALAADLAAIARARKAEFARYAQQRLPNHFETIGAVYHGNSLEDEADAAPATVATGELRGTGCYPGIVESTVKVILSPDDELTVDRRILCTLRTDPGWAPLFPTASGILVERGSTLSHSAVLARELGIPAIVGVPQLLARLANGDRVRMNGGTGLIERTDERTERSEAAP